MRIALCNEVIRELAFERQCVFARAAGYDGLEIAPFTLGDEPQAAGCAPQRAAAAAADAGIAITGLHYLMLAPKGLSITSADAAQRTRTVEVMRRLCELAADLGAHILVHGSPAQRRLEPGQRGGGPQMGRRVLRRGRPGGPEGGRRLLHRAAGRPEANFINTVEEAAAIVRAIGNPALRTMVDCAAAGRAEPQPMPDLLRQWLPTGLIGHVHFNDPNRRGPGEGELAFAPILQALADGGYSGMAAVEPFIYEPDGPACAARAIGYVRGVMEASQSPARAERIRGLQKSRNRRQCRRASASASASG